MRLIQSLESTRKSSVTGKNTKEILKPDRHMNQPEHRKATLLGRFTHVRDQQLAVPDAPDDTQGIPLQDLESV